MPRKRNRSHGRMPNYFCTCGSWHTTHTGRQNHIAHYEREPDGRNHEEVEDDEDWDDEDWDDEDSRTSRNEPPEYEDMPGNTPEDREEAYDNFDWNALD